MAKEPQPEEIETVRRAAVLVMAALVYQRAVCDDSVEDYESVADWAFSAGSAFVRQAEKNGHDPMTIMQLTGGAF